MEVFNLLSWFLDESLWVDLQHGIQCCGNMWGSCDWKPVWDSFSLVGDNPISSSNTKQILATTTTTASRNPPLLHNQHTLPPAPERSCKLPSRKCGSDLSAREQFPDDAHYQYWPCLQQDAKDNESQTGKLHTLEGTHLFLPPGGVIFFYSKSLG